jgi:hypothetical protein
VLAGTFLVGVASTANAHRSELVHAAPACCTDWSPNRYGCRHLGTGQRQHLTQAGRRAVLQCYSRERDEAGEPQQGPVRLHAGRRTGYVRPNPQPEGPRSYGGLAHQLPTWLTSGTWTKAELRAILREHIFAEVAHFRGQNLGLGRGQRGDRRYGLPANMQQDLYRVAALGLRPQSPRQTSAAIYQSTPPGSRLRRLPTATCRRAACSSEAESPTPFGASPTSTPGCRSTFPGEGYANLYTEDYKPKLFYDALRRDLALAAGIKKHR